MVKCSSRSAHRQLSAYFQAKARERGGLISVNTPPPLAGRDGEDASGGASARVRKEMELSWREGGREVKEVRGGEGV